MGIRRTFALIALLAWVSAAFAQTPTPTGTSTPTSTPTFTPTVTPTFTPAACTAGGTRTTNLGLCKPVQGETPWTNPVNDNWTNLDNAFGTNGALLPGRGGTGTNTVFPADSVPFAGANGVYTSDPRFAFDPATGLLTAPGFDSPSDPVNGDCVILREGTSYGANAVQICAPNSGLVSDRTISLSNDGRIPLGDTTGTLPLSEGGTNQTVFTAARCVRVSTDGTKLESATADCGSGTGDITDVFNCASGDCASVAMADGDLLDASAVAPNTTTEGIILPQTTYCGSASAEGQTCWDTDQDALYVGDGTAARRVGGFVTQSAFAGTCVGGVVRNSTWSLPSTATPTEVCSTGTNTIRAVLRFAEDEVTKCAHTQFIVPDEAFSVSSTVDVWLAAWWQTSATSGDVYWKPYYQCNGDGETDDQSWNQFSSWAADTAQGVANRLNKQSWTMQNVASCAPGDILRIRFCREYQDALDTLTATADLVEVQLKLPVR